MFVSRCYVCPDLIKNTILGTVVFEVYEQSYGIMQQRWNQEDTSAQHAFETSHHCIAGAIAGTSHAFLGLAFETMENRALPTFRYTMQSAIHHSLAHTVLFGSYAGVKYLLESMIAKQHQQRSATTSLAGGDEFLMEYQIGITATAGGVSGVVQNTVSHYTGMWLQVETTEKTMYQQMLANRTAVTAASIDSPAASGSRSIMRSMINSFRPLPPAGQTLLAFPGMAVAFLAFEYARDI
uniref:Uncharacterized protein n=1 Tax=Craspedostauros australis TaxID=1486917 RepID=A0A7R9ZT87_9STRA|mmetsp:Transcript_9307/g.25235  ORF Transcript_9307/g.25235 Transcript_9307/m.25235 type:complete len:238 (+) Transcript_9307:468-1181(+)